jgi:hypothetical protein
MTIRIQNTTAGAYQVRVESASTTVHSVTVTPEYLQKLTGGRAPAETLIEKSFEFLLERESNTSILRAFDLPVIQRYFPDYERTITSVLLEPWRTNTATSTPAVTRMAASMFPVVGFSPRKVKAITTARATLNLSMGATRDASPSFSAL